MNPTRSIEEVNANPLCLAAEIRAAGGAQVTFRPLLPTDGAALGRYFCGLSEATTSLYGPHPFDQPTADALCASIAYADTIRMIALRAGEAGQEEIIAYFILQLTVPSAEIERYAAAGVLLDPRLDCLIAPSIADAHQNQGLGTPLMEHVFAVARGLGRRNIVLMGGVLMHNERAVHYYRKLGFQPVGTFVESGPSRRASYDMLRLL